MLQKVREENEFKNACTQDRRIMYCDAVNEVNCIIIKVYYHDTLQCVTTKLKFVLAFVVFFFIIIIPSLLLLITLIKL